MKYTVYLGILWESKYVKADFFHVTCDNADEDAILDVAYEKFAAKYPDFTDWAIKTYFIAKGHITPVAYSTQL